MNKNSEQKEYKLSMKERLECNHSFADESSPHLLCDYDGVCDGFLYECCIWDNEQLEENVRRFLFE